MVDCVLFEEIIPCLLVCREEDLAEECQLCYDIFDCDAEDGGFLGELSLNEVAAIDYVLRCCLVCCVHLLLC